MGKSQKTKTPPMRTCIVTREKLPKKDLLRLVRVVVAENEGAEKEGIDSNKSVAEKYGVRVDLRSQLQGRGANIKPDLDVFELALEKGHIERALQLGRSLTIEEKHKLRQEFTSALEEKAFRPNNKKVKFKVSQQKMNEVFGE